MPSTDFVMLGAHRALDFVNTRTVDRGRTVERLGDFDALLRFARRAELLPAADAEVAYRRWSAAAERAQVLADAVALREAVRRWLSDARALDALVARVDAHLAHPAPRLRLVRPEGPVVRQRWLDDAPPTALLRALAEDVAALLCDVERGAVRRCAAPDCEAWFAVAGRTVERVWCSAQRCGVRMRSARYEESGRRPRWRRVRGPWPTL